MECREFVNADLIAWGLSPFASEGQAMRAGRLALARIQELGAAGEDFGFETTLSGRSYVPLLTRLREQGYRIHLFFLWLPAADLAVARVANRVRQGGHDIPEPVIRRRFKAGLRNFYDLYVPLADEWWILDACKNPPLVMAEYHNGHKTIHDPAAYTMASSSRSEDR